MDVSSSDGGVVKVEQTTPSSYPVTNDFKSRTNVHLEAVPTPGYFFNNWSGDLSDTTNPTTVLMDCDKRIQANFSQISPVPVNWPLVGGILGGWVLVGLIVALLIVRRRARSALHRTSTTREHFTDITISC
ncbi:hypothetical protein ACFLUF_00240 [Chloroflexota bacterium]